MTYLFILYDTSQPIYDMSAIISRNQTSYVGSKRGLSLDSSSSSSWIWSYVSSLVEKVLTGLQVILNLIPSKLSSDQDIF